MNRIFLIDGHAQIFRMYYAFMRHPMVNSKGMDTSIIFGFTKMVLELVEKERPTHIAVAFDPPAKTFRHETYPEYKANRSAAPELVKEALEPLTEILQALNIPVVMVPGFEADDVIGSMACQWSGTEDKIYMVTPDKDYGQLVSENVYQYKPAKGGGETEILGKEQICSHYGITDPRQVIDILTIWGDSSDNIPGVQGIGNKRACELLSAYGSVAGVYAHIDEIKGKLKENLEKGRQSCEMSYALATIKTDCDIDIPVSELTYRFPFSREVMEFFDRHDFKSLTRRAELFGESVKVEERYEQAEIIAVCGAGELLAAADGHDKIGISFSDGRISLSPDGTHQYDLELKVDLISDGPTEGEALRALAPLLADEKIIKYVYDVKSVMRRLDTFGVRIRGYEDVALMDYLARPNFKYSSAEGFAETLGLNPYSDAAALIQGGRNLMHTLEESGMNKLYREMELPLTEVLFDMQKTGFKLDLKLLEELKRKYTALADESTERIYELAGRRFNINSPKQLGIVLFDELKIPYPKKRSERSTSAEILGAIKDAHPVVEEVLRYRFVSKIKSTYLEGLSKVAGTDGVVHTEFNQMQTSTGRLSSSEPNLQNIPVREEDGKALRALFIARDGNVLVNADYSQIELRVMAHLSGDENLIAAYMHGADIHTAVARELFGTSEPTAKQRRVAKTVNFGIIYGMSAYGLGDRLGIPTSEAKSYIDKYFSRFPRVHEYLEEVVKSAREKGYAESLFGRRRVISELNSRDYRTRGFGERAAMNMPLQSTAADIIKIAMLKVYGALKGMRSKLILQVHDELIIDAPADEADAAAELLKREMESAVTLKVPLVASVNTGKSWLDCK